MSQAVPDSQAGQGGRLIRRLGLAILAVAALGALAIGLFLSSLGGAGDGPAPVADVSSERLLSVGAVVGFADAHETHAWLGLPYAAPPVGPLRWRAPRPARAWVETRDALAYGAPCPQVASLLGGVAADGEDGFAGREDCLTLNVWAPRFEPDGVPTGTDRRPVLVWIHGGGNTRGFSGSPMYDGARFAGTQDVVIVSINYRLGPLGWFSHPAFRAEARDAAEASGNFGTLDQILALEWVQSHIAEFGGDPGNVTIFGESAGGLDVYALLLSPRSRGLFHRAIAQSGSTRAFDRADAETSRAADAPGRPGNSADTVVQLLVAAGAVPDEAAAEGYAAALSSADLREWLRGRSDREILEAVRDPEAPESLRLPKPFRDGVVLPKGDWLEAMRAGRFHRVPVLAGATRDEWKLFLSQDGRHVERRFKVLYRVRDPEDYERRGRLMSELRVVQGVHAPLAALAASGFDALYAYRFDFDAIPERFGQDLAGLVGAGHGLELPLLFGTFDVGDPLMSWALYGDEKGQPVRDRLSDQMMRYWAAFARDGRPGRGRGNALPEWTAWSGAGEAQDGQGVGGAGGRWMLLDDDAGGGLRMAQTTRDRAAVLASLTEDDGLDARARCALYVDVFHDKLGWSRDEFLRLPPTGCAAHADLLPAP